MCRMPMLNYGIRRMMPCSKSIVISVMERRPRLLKPNSKPMPYVMSIIHSFTQSLIHSITHSLIHSIISNEMNFFAGESNEVVIAVEIHMSSHTLLPDPFSLSLFFLPTGITEKTKQINKQ